jgi:hypothetical protein
MQHITLTEEQARILEATRESVEVRAPDGRVLTFVKMLDPELVETLALSRKRLATPGPWIPAERVEAFLQRLHEMEQSAEVTPEKVAELLRRVEAGEAP